MRGVGGTDSEDFIFLALVSHGDPLSAPPAPGDGQEAGGLHVTYVLVTSAESRSPRKQEQ